MKSGFTLFEIAIVTTIIGLILGGIFIGNDLIQEAEIRSTLRQVERLDAAYNTFRTKYNCIPGDCSKASKYGFTASPFSDIVFNYTVPQPSMFARFSLISSAWAGPVGGGGGGEVDPGGSSSISLADGNGNGRLGSEAEYYNSLYHMWQAGLIPDLNQSTGHVPLAMKTASTAGAQAFWYVSFLTPGVTGMLPADDHYYWATSSFADGGSGAGVMPPAKASRFDTKKDDGLPQSGDIRATGRDTNLNPASSGPAFDADADAGPAGAASPYCVTDASPNQYNVLNPATDTVIGARCTVTIKAHI